MIGVISLAGDLEVRRRLAAHIDVGGRALAAVQVSCVAERLRALGMPEGAPYVNAGELLFNVMRLSGQRRATRGIDYASRAGRLLAYHDQDAVNAILRGQTLAPPVRWSY